MDITSVSNRPGTGSAAADTLTDVIDSAKSATAKVESTVQDGLDKMRDTLPGVFAKVGRQCDQAAYSAKLRVNQLCETTTDKVQGLHTQSVDYVRSQPMKSVMIAAAAGAGLMLLLSALSSRRIR